jgi:hypothetical protein
MQFSDSAFQPAEAFSGLASPNIEAAQIAPAIIAPV